MDLSKYQSIRESQNLYNELYKNIANKNPKWLHYSLLRIAGVSRHDSYTKAGYKNQGYGYAGSSLNSSNGVHIEKNYPLILDFIEIGKHLNMQKMLENQKSRILTQEERMLLMSDIATGSHKTIELRKVTSIRKNRKVTTMKKFESVPNLNSRMKAVDILNKMDNSYKQEIIIRKSESDSLKDMSVDELAEQLSQFENIIKNN